MKVNTPKRQPVEQRLRITLIGMIERDKGVTVLLRELLRFDRLDAVEIHIHGKSRDTIYMSEVHKLAREYPGGTVMLHGAYRSDKELLQSYQKLTLLFFLHSGKKTTHWL